MKSLLMLEDGYYVFGESLGASGTAFGEVVFNTSMTGYQEILTDPSYHYQLVTLTYPLIGNYGIHPEDAESDRIHASGLVIRECSATAGHSNSVSSLDDYLKNNGVVAVEGIDTRALTRHIRSKGAMRGAISSEILSPDNLKEKVLESPRMEGLNLAEKVTRKDIKNFNSENLPELFHVVVVDFGVKNNILQSLLKRNCRITRVPAFSSFEEINSLSPDGVLLSNGPGDPAAVVYAIETTRKLLASYPMFGICLGHQILCLALGGKTYKLRFGHRGGNQPVMDLRTGRVSITSHNHGFSVDKDSLPPGTVDVTHINLNDKTVEGVRHKSLPVFSVQYHPEACPGPHDADNLFDEFIDVMKNSKK